MRSPAKALRFEPGDWPASDGRRVVFLVETASRLERRALLSWIDEHRPEEVPEQAYDVVAVPCSRRTRRGRGVDPRLEGALSVGDDPILAPLRVAWFPRRRDGVHAVRLRDLLTLGDARDPGLIRQWWIRQRSPDRCQIVVGEPAPLSELRERWRRLGGARGQETSGLAEFVTRQAVLALERAERQLRGAHYKVPRFVREEILARPAFRGGIARLARELGRKERRVARDAERYLREIAATHSPYVIDVAAHLCRFLYTRGYSENLEYDRSELERIYSLGQQHPLVFLPSHKSQLDHVVLQYLLYENQLPPNHTAGGINMNFLGVGPLFRRSGVFFIRRSFKDNAIYKFVLSHYLDYLIEKRFSLEWYIEGGRSRSGKLLPPRFGLLASVVDAYRRGKSEDVILVPVSIAYDQIQDVGDYVSEQRGGQKESESFGWFVRFVRAFRGGYGTVHIRFGDPLSLRKFLGPPDPEIETDTDRPDLDLRKLSFEVCVRINRATPVTTTAALTLALLGAGDRALSLAQMPRALKNLLSYLRRRQLPTTLDFDLESPEGIERGLETLVRSGVVARFDEGPEPVYMIGPDQHLAAAFYRNSVVQFFVNGAIAELALLRAADEDVEDRLAEFWEECLRLRDLLKFEFFFPLRDAFVSEVQQEMMLHEPAWESHLRLGPNEVRGLLAVIRPLSAHRALRPFVEAYLVVGDMLEREDAESRIDPEAFLRRCIGLGKQYHLQRRIRSLESVSKVLFQTALELARNRDLLSPGSPDLLERRRAFAEEIRDAAQRIEAVDAVAAGRRVGLID
jgi:glycerol-3-phosphate O-acyltransferase